MLKSIKILPYLFSQGSTFIQPVLIMPMLASVLTKQKFGEFSTFLVWMNILIPVIAWGNSVFLLKNSKAETSLWSWHRVLSFNFIMALLLLGVSQLLAESTGKVLFYSVIAALMVVLLNFLKTRLRLLNKGWTYFYSTLMVYVIMYLLLLLMVTPGVETNQASLIYIISYAVLVILLLVIWQIKSKRSNYDTISISFSNHFIFGLPLVGHAIVAKSFAYFDKILISSYYGDAILGEYYSVFQLGFAISAFGFALQAYYAPAVFKLMRENAQISLFEILRLPVSALLLATVLMLIFFSYIYTHLYPSNYTLYRDIYYFFIIGALFQSLYWLLVPILQYNNRHHLFFITSAVALFSVIAIIIFIKRDIKYGAIIYLTGWFLQFSLVTLYSLKIFKKKVG